MIKFQSLPRQKRQEIRDEVLRLYSETDLSYGEIAEENGVQGRVLVSFVITKDGSLSNVRVVKSVDPALDKEAVRLIKSMPKCSPGKEKGQFVNVKFTVPVTYRIQQIGKKGIFYDEDICEN